ncbi:hypothetical protein ACFWN7_01855 [Agromyces sp. NPDC058484]|uniref:hypothetical protein n=1 Tax=Agromyces sp. NPDC058484 TaxID=3346524 RepID=UPI00364DF040
MDRTEIAAAALADFRRSPERLQVPGLGVLSRRARDDLRPLENSTFSYGLLSSSIGQLPTLEQGIWRQRVGDFDLYLLSDDQEIVVLAIVSTDRHEPHSGDDALERITVGGVPNVGVYKH